MIQRYFHHQAYDPVCCSCFLVLQLVLPDGDVPHGSGHCPGKGALDHVSHVVCSLPPPELLLVPPDVLHGLSSHPGQGLPDHVGHDCCSLPPPDWQPRLPEDSVLHGLGFQPVQGGPDNASLGQVVVSVGTNVELVVEGGNLHHTSHQGKQLVLLQTFLLNMNHLVESSGEIHPAEGLYYNVLLSTRYLLSSGRLYCCRSGWKGSHY